MTGLRIVSLIAGIVYSLLMILAGIFTLLAMSKFGETFPAAHRPPEAESALSGLNYLFMGIAVSFFALAVHGVVAVAIVFAKSGAATEKPAPTY